ncbi:MAG: beta-phosphoglucomutase [Bacteroidales bacterium]
MTKCCIFDLDGVLVDTARYHFLAWKSVAKELGFDFVESDNERLKGVSRMASLEILLSIGHVSLTSQEKQIIADRKNMRYVEYIRKMTPEEVLPGVSDFLAELRGKNILIALGSASKNARTILKQTDIEHLFDAVADGNNVTNAKPDPEVFLKAAALVGASPSECIVFEDAVAGVEAAHRARMRCVGVGDPLILNKADHHIRSFTEKEMLLSIVKK